MEPSKKNALFCKLHLVSCGWNCLGKHKSSDENDEQGNNRNKQEEREKLCGERILRDIIPLHSLEMAPFSTRKPNGFCNLLFHSQHCGYHPCSSCCKLHHFLVHCPFFKAFRRETRDQSLYKNSLLFRLFLKNKLFPKKCNRYSKWNDICCIGSIPRSIFKS